MPPRSYTIGTPTNPILQFLYLLLGGILLIGAILMGAVILAIAFGLALIFGLVIFVRVWWLKRKLERRARAAGVSRRTGADGDVLEVEYTIVEERDKRDGDERP